MCSLREVKYNCIFINTLTIERILSFGDDGVEILGMLSVHHYFLILFSVEIL